MSNNFLKKIVKKTCLYLKVKQADISIIFTDTAHIRKLNKKYRQQNQATDVLSFAYREQPVEGDILICLELVRAEALKNHSSFTNQLAITIIHSILHLLGYDHKKQADLVKMQQKENEIRHHVFKF